MFTHKPAWPEARDSSRPEHESIAYLSGRFSQQCMVFLYMGNASLLKGVEVTGAFLNKTKPLQRKHSRD
jgi:hypothetical protein